MSVTAFSQYKVYEYVDSGIPALATYTGMTFTQDGTNFLDALNASSQSVVSMPANYIATCDSNYRYNVSQMTSYSNIGANFPSNGSYEFENQTTKFVLKIKDLRGNIAYSKDLEIDMNTTYFGFFMNSHDIGGVIIYRINDANCDVVIKGNSTFDNMYKTVYTIDGRDPLPDLEGGGAGSGYIGNSLLSDKKMVGYNVPTSSAEGTKTESVNEVSASAVSGKPKSGNGFARIKFLREPDYYWIAQYTVDGTTYNLMQIGDVTIPDSIINATQMTCTAITGRGSTVPSFVTNLGDIIFDLQSSIDADVTLEFINNSFLRFLFGRYDYIDSGTRMSGNQYYDVANSRVFYQGGWGNFGDGKVKYYIAIKIDKVNHRAYMIVIEHTYYHWSGNVGYTAFAIGGMPNGVDLLYETFKDVR